MLVAIRSLAFQSVFLPSTAVFALLVLLAWPLPLSARESVARAWCRFVLALLRGTCGVRCRIEGLEHLPPGPAVILSKHQSAWETIAYRAIFPVQLSWVIKRSLFRIPFYGWALKALEEIGIDRDAGREALRQIERAGLDHLRDGRWVVIFPEGTRTEPGEAGRYAQGGARLACAAGAPVVPVAVDSGRCWPATGWRRYPGTITVSIGPPIETSGRNSPEVTRQARDWIEARLHARSSGETSCRA